MPISSPPSSRRLPATELNIPVTMVSRAMQQLARDILQQENVFLVLSADDMAEFRSFTEAITRSGNEPPRFVRPKDGTFGRDPRIVTDQNLSQGLVILETHRLDKSMIDGFVRICQIGHWYDMVIAVVPTMPRFKQVFDEFSIDFTDFFSEQPLEWPSLKDREADLNGILHEICSVLISADGRIMAELSQTGIDAILARPAKRVMELYTTTRGAFDVMLRCNERVITAEHVHIARNPDRRRRLFRQSGASAD